MASGTIQSVPPTWGNRLSGKPFPDSNEQLLLSPELRMADISIAGELVKEFLCSYRIPGTCGTDTLIGSGQEVVPDPDPVIVVPFGGRVAQGPFRIGTELHESFRDGVPVSR